MPATAAAADASAPWPVADTGLALKLYMCMPTVCTTKAGFRRSLACRRSHKQAEAARTAVPVRSCGDLSGMSKIRCAALREAASG